MRRLSELIAELPGLLPTAVPEKDITHLTADSRQVRPGSLFVAWKGHTTDGHAFIPEAIERGAVAILAEVPVPVPPEVAFLQSTSSRLSYAHLCSRWFDHPQKRLHIVGITGTNGKSSTAYYLYHLWQGLGYKAGLIGTVFCLAGSEKLPATLTTPDSFELYRLLRHFADQGVERVAMEVSSIALDQHRTAGIAFAGGLFTNLSHDHLDYHKTFTSYRDAKKRLFDQLSPTSFALTNIDDRNGLFMLQNTSAERYTYSVESLGSFSLRLESSDLWGLSYSLLLDLGSEKLPGRWERLQMEVPSLQAALIGRFQAYNLLAAVGGAFLSEGPLPEKAARELWLRLAHLSTTLKTLPGRLEPVFLSQGRVGLVDYAHTPDAVEKVLQALRPLVPLGGKLIAVLGAGGNRDRTKRAPMAHAATQHADLVVLTSDNPRNEDPQAILADMYDPLPTSVKNRILRIVDRAEAIRTAVQWAPPHSLIAILGKGHETYQEIAGVKHPFSDIAILQACQEVPYAG